MADELRDHPGGGGRVGFTAALAVVLLLAAVGGGYYFATKERDAAREADTQAGTSQEPARVERQPPKPPVPSDAPQVFEGKVVRLDSPGKNLALAADGGTRRPIVEDDGSKMLF